MSINFIFLTIISQTSSGRSTKISKKKSIRNLKLLWWKSLLVFTDPVDRLVKCLSRKKSVGISNNIRVRNAVNMMETLNSSLRHYFLIQTKRVKLRRIKLNVTCPSIQLYLFNVNRRYTVTLQILINLLRPVSDTWQKKIEVYKIRLQFATFDHRSMSIKHGFAEGTRDSSPVV